MKKFLTIFTIGAMMALVSCSDDPDPEPEVVTYTNTIKAELAGCAVSGCHGDGSANGSGSLDTYEDVVAFVGFDRILGALRHEEGFSPMPKGGDKWTEAEVSRLEAWIAAGLPE